MIAKMSASPYVSDSYRRKVSDWALCLGWPSSAVARSRCPGWLRSRGGARLARQLRMEELGTGGLYQLLHGQPMTEMVYMALQQLAYEKVCAAGWARGLRPLRPGC